MAASNNKQHYTMETIRVWKLDHANLFVQCNFGQAQELKEFFSFFVPGYQFMPAFKRRVWDGKIRLFDSNTNELPAGLIYHLIKFCETRGYVIEPVVSEKYGPVYSEERPKGKDLLNFVEKLNLPFKIRDYQYLAVIEGLKRKRAILLSPTGSGKSLIIYTLASWFLAHNRQKVLVIVPTTSLVEQMENDFVSYNMPKGLSHKIYSGKDKDTKCPIVISTWQSIYKLPKQWFQQFGMIIGDECHGFKSKSLMQIMNKCTEAAYRFGTTGTLDGTQTHELVLQGLFGKIYKVTTTKALQDNDTLAQLNIKRIVLDYDKEAREDFGKRTYQEEIEWIVSNEKRNSFISNLAVDQKGNTLVLFNYVDKHGKPLFDMINSKVDEKRKVFFVSGQVDTSDREAIRGIVEKQKNAIIVASLGTFSTGINIRNLHNIIFASPSKSQIRVLQSIGRGLRKSDNGEATTLYDIIDDLRNNNNMNFAYLHSDERHKIYNREKFDNKTYKVEINGSTQHQTIQVDE
jgi:superfamily II DNA or RNA helicase